MNTFNLNFMLKIALKHWVSLGLAAVICAAAFFGYYNYIAEPKYAATGSIVVTNGTIISESEHITGEEKLENSDIVASINFVDTVTDVLDTNDIYKLLSEEIGGVYDFGQLKARTSIQRRSETTLFIDITFVAPTPQSAVEIVNEYLNIAPDYIASMVKNVSSSITPADSASWMYPNDIVLIAAGAFCGVAMLYLMIFLVYSTSSLIRDEESFKDMIDVDVIGVVPDFSASRTSRYYKYSNYYGYGGK